MEAIVGTTLGPFVGLTLVLFGLCAYLAGQGIAETWRPSAMVFVAGFGLGLGDRFLQYALFSADLLSLPGYLVQAVVLSAYAWVGFRLTRAGIMVRQYPWAYERSGIFTWREKSVE